jgi:hypothetical protein
VRNRDAAGLYGVLKLYVASPLIDLVPAIGLQLLDDRPAVHNARNITKAISFINGMWMSRSGALPPGAESARYTAMTKSRRQWPIISARVTDELHAALRVEAARQTAGDLSALLRTAMLTWLAAAAIDRIEDEIADHS